MVDEVEMEGLNYEQMEEAFYEEQQVACYKEAMEEAFYEEELDHERIEKAFYDKQMMENPFHDEETTARVDREEMDEFSGEDMEDQSDDDMEEPSDEEETGEPCDEEEPNSTPRQELDISAVYASVKWDSEHETLLAYQLRLDKALKKARGEATSEDDKKSAITITTDSDSNSDEEEEKQADVKKNHVRTPEQHKAYLKELQAQMDRDKSGESLRRVPYKPPELLGEVVARERAKAARREKKAGKAKLAAGEAAGAEKAQKTEKTEKTETTEKAKAGGRHADLAVEASAAQRECSPM